MFPATSVLDGLVFPEGPRWRDGRLVFSDFHARRISAFDSVSGALQVLAELDDAPSGLGWRPDGTLLFVSMARRELRELGPEGPCTVADLSAVCLGWANDMVVASDGSAFIASFGFDMLAGAPPEPTALAYVDPAGRVSAAGDDLLFPNGMVLLDDERTLVVAETYRNRLTAFDVGPGGALTGRRTWAQFDDSVAPDGICTDAERGIWVAAARNPRCVRVDAAGAITDEVKMQNGDLAFACMLGGEDGRDLYVCTAPSFRPPRNGERWGKLQHVRVTVRHAGRP